MLFPIKVSQGFKVEFSLRFTHASREKRVERESSIFSRLVWASQAVREYQNLIFDLVEKLNFLWIGSRQARTILTFRTAWPLEDFNWEPPISVFLLIHTDNNLSIKMRGRVSSSATNTPSSSAKVLVPSLRVAQLSFTHDGLSDPGYLAQKSREKDLSPPFLSGL